MKNLQEALKIIENYLLIHGGIWQLGLCQILHDNSGRCKDCPLDTLEISPTLYQDDPNKVISIIKKAIRKQKLEKLLK